MYSKWVESPLDQRDGSLPLGLRQGQRWARVICLLAISAMAGIGWSQQQASATPPTVAGDASTQDVGKPTEANQAPSVVAEDGNSSNSEALHAERKREIAEQSANLLRMAHDLKTEMDMTTNETLSAAAFRKADAIEKLTKYVRDKSKHANKK